MFQEDSVFKRKHAPEVEFHSIQSSLTSDPKTDTLSEGEESVYRDLLHEQSYTTKNNEYDDSTQPVEKELASLLSDVVAELAANGQTDLALAWPLRMDHWW